MLILLLIILLIFLTSCESNSKEEHVYNSNNTSNEVERESSKITNEYTAHISKEYILNLENVEIDLEVLLVNIYFKIEELNKQELNMLRNAYYAKYGYIFQNQTYNEFFELQNWYEPNESVTDVNALLTQTDWKNIELIREIENRGNDDGIELKFKDLGFSLILPSSWEGHYYIDKNERGIVISFKPDNNPIAGVGHLFSILDTKFVDYEYMLDSVSNRRYLVVEERKYIIGGPTDVNFPEAHDEFYTFHKMGKQVGHIIGTLETID